MGQIASGNFINIDGADLTFAPTIIDNDGNGVVADQVASVSLLRKSDSKWWNDATSDFDLGAEPALDTAVLDGSTGIWVYTFTGGFDLTSLNYRVHVQLTDTVEFDFYQDIQLNLNENLASIMAITDILNSVDGIGLEDRETFLLAYIKGKVERTGNSLEYKKQNGTTKAFTLTGTTGVRTPT